MSGLGSLCGGDEASKADGLGGEAGGEGRVRLWGGPGWGGNPVRQMSHIQHEARGGSGACGGGRVVRLERGPGWGGNPERQMSHTQQEARGGSGWARWSPCRSRMQAQSLSTRGLSLRRCERRRRPGPPRQSASRQRACLRAARLTVGPGRGVGAVRQGRRGGLRSRPPTRRPGRRCARCPSGHLACVVASTGCVRARWSWSQRQGPASACVGQGPVGADEQSQSARRSSHRNRLVQRTGGEVLVSSAIAPRDVSARARPPRLIEPSGQRLRGALPAAAGTRAPLVVIKWPRGVATVVPFQARMAWRSACCVSCLGAAQGGSRSGA